MGNQIYININYNLNIKNEKAVKKAENFDYSDFIEFPYSGNDGLKYYIDEDLIEELVDRVENSKKQFHWNFNHFNFFISHLRSRR